MDRPRSHPHNSVTSPAAGALGRQENAIAIDNYSHAAGQVGTAYACWGLDSNPGVLSATCRRPCPTNAGQTWSCTGRSSRSRNTRAGLPDLDCEKRLCCCRVLRLTPTTSKCSCRSDDHGLTWTTPQSVDCEPRSVALPGQLSATSRCPAWVLGQRRQPVRGLV